MNGFNFDVAILGWMPLFCYFRICIDKQFLPFRYTYFNIID